MQFLPLFISRSCFLLFLQTMAHMKVVAFQGNAKVYVPPAPETSLPPVTDLDLTPSPDVPLAIMKRKMMFSNDLRLAKSLLVEIDNHLKVRNHPTTP